MSRQKHSAAIPAHRRALVLEYLRKQGAASIQELAEAIGASGSTIRRDLEHLENRGYLARSHGGALLQRTEHSTFEPEPAISAELARAEKDAIGALAASCVNPRDSVVLDSSSTVLAAARHLARRDIPLTAVTNDLGIGQVLAAAERIKVVVPGGTLRPGSLTLLGPPGQGFFDGIRADIAFIGTHAISDGMLSDTSLELAAVKRAIIASARRVVLLADSSKFQPPAFCAICGIERIHELITDRAADEAQLARIAESGVTVTLADRRRAD